MSAADDDDAPAVVQCTDPALIIEALKSIEPMTEPLAGMIKPTMLDRTKLFHWQMWNLRTPLEDLSRPARTRVVFVGDAAHTMPILIGEGGNHATMDGVELSRAMAAAGKGIEEAAELFYAQAYPRWQEGIVREGPADAAQVAGRVEGDGPESLDV